MAGSNAVVVGNGPLVRMGARRASDEIVAEVHGELVYFEVREFDSKDKPGTKNYKHEITLRSGRQEFKCVMWYDQVVDVSSLENERMSFGVVYFKADQYGREIGTGGGRVICVGKLAKGICDQFAR
jgi:hypothetical protein